MLNIPNSLTIFRIIGSISLPIFLLFNSPETGCLLALIIFLSCSITDFLDGFLARKLNQESNLGRMLDPVADKLLVILVLSFLILIYQDTYNYILGIPSVVVISREILVSGIREYFGSTDGNFDVMKLSKLKTAMQRIAIICLLTSKLSIFENLYLSQLGIICLWFAAGFALYTGLVYIYRAIILLNKEKT